MENCVGIIILIHTDIVATVEHTTCAENERITLGYVRLENAIKRQGRCINEGKTKAYRVFR